MKKIIFLIALIVMTPLMVSCNPTNRSMQDDAVNAVVAMLEKLENTDHISILSIEWFEFPSWLVPNHPDYTSYTFSITYQDETLMSEEQEARHCYIIIEKDEVRYMVCNEKEAEKELYQMQSIAFNRAYNKKSPQGAYSERQIEKIVNIAKSILNTNNT